MTDYEEDYPDYNPFWDGGAAALLLVAIAVSMFVFLCLPAKRSANEVHQQMTRAEGRVEKMYDELKAYRIKADELRRGDPEAVEEAIREQLIKGEEGEYVL